MDTKTLFENKKEYLQHLQDVVVEPFLTEFQTIYESTLKSCATGKVLQEFQSNVAKVAEWNHIMIEALHERVVEQSKCAFLDDLIRAIFITYVRFNLASHGKLHCIDKVNIRVPNAANFLHKCITACARVVWRQPYLFYHAVRSIERQHNRVQAEDEFRKAIASTVRNAIPWEQLLTITLAAQPVEEHFLSDDDDSQQNNDNEDDDVASTEEAESSDDSYEEPSDDTSDDDDKDDLILVETINPSVEDDTTESQPGEILSEIHENSPREDSHAEEDDTDVDEDKEVSFKEELVEEDDDEDDLVRLTEDDIPQIEASSTPDIHEVSVLSNSDDDGDSVDAGEVPSIQEESGQEEPDRRTIIIEPRSKRVTDAFF